jgi:sialate O-acetylesterase
LIWAKKMFISSIYKKEVGERLARLALARTNKQSVVDSAPVFKSMNVEGYKIRLIFSPTSGGLVAKPLLPQYQLTSTPHALKPLVRHSPACALEGFPICGAD